MEFGTGFGGEHESSGNADGAEAVEFVGIVKDFGFDGLGCVAGSESVLTDGLCYMVGDFLRGVLNEEVACDGGPGGGVINGAFALEFLRSCHIVEDGGQMNDGAVSFGYFAA